MLPDKTYILRFHHTNGTVEDFEHTREDEATAMFNLFGEECSDIYAQLMLVEYDWHTRKERTIAIKGFEIEEG